MTTNDNPSIVQIESPQELAKSLASVIVQRLRQAIELNGSASLVLSGGSTPKPLFEALRVQPLAWDKVTITLADERWVPESSPDSNAAFIKTTLLQDQAAAAKFVGLYANDVLPHDGVGQIDQQIKAIAQPFTVVVLGMGGDGHTASLFPGAPGTDAAVKERDAMVAIVEPETVPQARITLTLAALMNTDCQLLHITGSEKRQLLDEVLQDPKQSPYPIAHFLHPDNSKITVYSTH